MAKSEEVRVTKLQERMTEAFTVAWNALRDTFEESPSKDTVPLDAQMSSIESMSEDELSMLTATFANELLSIVPPMNAALRELCLHRLEYPDCTAISIAVFVDSPEDD